MAAPVPLHALTAGAAATGNLANVAEEAVHQSGSFKANCVAAAAAGLAAMAAAAATAMCT